MRPLQEIIRQAAGKLQAIAEKPLREARLLAAHVLKKSYEDIYFNPPFQLTGQEEEMFHALVERRSHHEPLSRITGLREFWGLPFKVTPDTLDPRPDSETVIEAILYFYPDKLQPLKIIDLGTGTGCLLLSALHEYPNAKGLGVDISEAACRVAKENAGALGLKEGLKDRCAFMAGNWGQALKGSFDIIISNPPYIKAGEPLARNVADYDPALALYGGDDGLGCYRSLATEIPALARPDSRIFLETGAGQREDIESIFGKPPLKVFKDLQGHDRCIVYGI